MMSISRGMISRGYAGRRFLPCPSMDADLSARFGAAVREIRRSRGISQERLAAVAGIDRAYMGGIERGERNPTLSMIQRVAEGLEMPISELFLKVESTRRKRR
jgi:transcriptional regulator with XRE-family HTH domain